MKELQIIVKDHSDGNPLNLPKGGAPIDGMTIGWKFEHTDGKMYGDYIAVPEGAPEELVIEVIGLLTRQAYLTEREL